VNPKRLTVACQFCASKKKFCGTGTAGLSWAKPIRDLMEMKGARLPITQI
jgi:hypothetical protein